MAAPTFIAASTGGTDATGAWVATSHAPGAAGRIIILQCLQDGTTAGAVTFTSATNIENLAGADNAWTQIPGPGTNGAWAVGTGPGAYQYLWIGRSLSTTAPTFTGGNTTSEDTYWRFYEFDGVNTGATLAAVLENIGGTSDLYLNGTGLTAAGDQTVKDTAVVTSAANRLALNFVALNDDIAIDAFAGQTGGSWIEAADEFAQSSGTDGCLQLQLGYLGIASLTPTFGTLSIFGGSGTNEAHAQSFASGAGGTVSAVAFKAQKALSPADNVVVEIRNDTSGAPGSTVLGSATLSASTITGAEQYYSVTLAATLSASTTYWLVFSRSGSRDTSNYVQIITGTGSTYSGGVPATRASGTWSSGTDDLSFAIDLGAATINGGSDSIATNAISWGVVGFALLPAVSGPTTYYGLTQSAYSFTPVELGHITSKTNPVVTPFAVNRVVTGKVSAKSRVDSPFTFGRVVAGKLGLKSRVDSPFTFGAVTQGTLYKRARPQGGTKNRVSNGGFESGATTGWTPVGSTLSVDAAHFSRYGSKHGDITTDNVAINEGAYCTFEATNAAQPYTISMWIADEHGTHNLRLKVTDNAGANAQNGSPFTPPGTNVWTRYSFTTTPLAAGTWRLYVETVAKALADYDMDGVQAQSGSAATVYIPTSSGPAVSFIPFALGSFPHGKLTAKGRVDSPFTFGRVTNGTRTTFGQVITPFTFGEVVSGRVTPKGRVDSPFTFGAVVDGTATTPVNTLFGEVISPFTFGEVVNGTRTVFGKVDSPFTFGQVTSGRVTAKSSVVTPFTFTAVESGYVTAKSSVVSPFTFGELVAGYRISLGQAVSPFTFGEVVSGKVHAYAQVVLPFLFDAVTKARGGAGVVESPFTFGSVVTGKVEARAQVVSPFTFGEVTTGRLDAKGQLSLAFAFDALTIGRPTARSSVTTPFTFDAVTTGRLDAYAQVSLPFTFGVVTQAGGAGGNVVSPFTFGAVVSGRVDAHAQVATPFTFGEVVSGRLGARGQVVLPFSFGRVVNGTNVLRGFVSLPFSFGEVTTGRVGAYGRVDLPFTFGIFTAARGGGGIVLSPFTFGRVVDGHTISRGRVVTPFTFGEVVSGRLGAKSRVALPLTFSVTSVGLLEVKGRVDLPFVFGELTVGRIDAHGQVSLPFVWVQTVNGFTGFIILPHSPTRVTTTNNRKRVATDTGQLVATTANNRRLVTTNGDELTLNIGSGRTRVTTR